MMNSPWLLSSASGSSDDEKSRSMSPLTMSSSGTCSTPDNSPGTQSLNRLIRRLDNDQLKMTIDAVIARQEKYAEAKARGNHELADRGNIASNNNVPLNADEKKPTAPPSSPDSFI